jgi:hypothetical protein
MADKLGDKSSRINGLIPRRIFCHPQGLEALMGVKTVGQIAREYQVHPVQVTQWKGVIRDP